MNVECTGIRSANLKALDLDTLVYDKAKIPEALWGVDAPEGQLFVGDLWEAIGWAIGRTPKGELRIVLEGTKFEKYKMRVLEVYEVPADYDKESTPPEKRSWTIEEEKLKLRRLSLEELAKLIKLVPPPL
jgi:hypothetical protein